MYSHIASNKRKTLLLMLSMSILVLGLSVLFGFSIGIDIPSALVLGGVFTIIYALISYYASSAISLAVNKAKPLVKADAPELYRIVENLCIANGQTMPSLYIINDPSPNAFATGRDPEHAALAFTSGLLTLLDKQELEAVAAHELSHVKNYDIRIMTVVVVLIGAVMLLSDLLLRGMGGNRREQHGALIIIGAALALLTPVCAEIIKLAISREREYLADASGALLTRYPAGLARALQKISTFATPLQSVHQATAHLFISSPFGEHRKKTSWLTNLFATHPPIDERIARLQKMDV